MAAGLDQAGERIQKLRWRARLAGGFDPMRVAIPKRFMEVTTWKGQADAAYLENLRLAYGTAIRNMGRADMEDI